jgi:hypothetical protein
MSDRAVIVAALIIGGAIVATSFSTRARYSLSAANNNVAWRMDTWSGNIDICSAIYRPDGPLVRCGAVVITPAPTGPNSADPASPDLGPPTAAPLERPRDQANVTNPSRAQQVL